jgi:hypothetical protein
MKLYLVDNSPTDELKLLVTDSRIEYIYNPNPGFGASHNVAIQAFELESDYHLVLNPIFILRAEHWKNFVSLWFNLNVGHVMPKVTYLMEFQYLKYYFLICLQRFYAFVFKKEAKREWINI